METQRLPLFERLPRNRLRTVRFTPYRKGCGPSFTLTIWDTPHRYHTGQFKLAYELWECSGGKRSLLFTGNNYGVSPLHGHDSDQAVEGLMGFLTLRPGDTDPDHFADYQPHQLAFAAAHAETLACIVADRFGRD